MINTSWLKISKPGLYVTPAYAHIDPVRAVDTAIITHGHADHARAGHGHVIATPEPLEIMSVRYGASFAGQQTALPYNQKLMLGDISVKLIPAGHVLGSAQIVLENANTKIIAAGDYKRQYDPTCEPFEVVKADIFITNTKAYKKLIKAHKEIIESVAGVNSISFIDQSKKPPQSATAVIKNMELFIPLKGLIDIDIEIDRLTRRIETIKKHILSSKKKLANSNFVEKAPQEIILHEKNKLSQFNQESDLLKKNLEMIL